MGGCATAIQTEKLRSTPPLDLPVAWELTQVPFYPQQQYQCGPAALAMLLNHVGISITADELVSQVYLPARKGSLQIEILATTRRHRLIPYVITPRLDSLLQEIEAGNPVLVLQNLGLGWAPVWHYAVAVGYNLQQQDIILHTGTEQARSVSFRTFGKTWQRADNWGMVITPIDQVPASAEPDRFLAAIATLKELDNSRHRHQAYRAAAQRWPDQLLPQLGLGNSFYGLGDLAAAERVYRTIIEQYPLSALALNNLAQTLADQNRLDEALGFARQAVELGGPFLSETQQTLDEIEKKQTSDK